MNTLQNPFNFSFCPDPTNSLDLVLAVFNVHDLLKRHDFIKVQNHKIQFTFEFNL